MTTRETNEIYDLTGTELDLVTGGSLTSGVRGATVRIISSRISGQFAHSPGVAD